MKYIKVFCSSNVFSLQKEVDDYCEEKKHNVIQQCSSVSVNIENGRKRAQYLLTVTFDDGEF